ncbi:hypothetical protein DFS34DRAFT_619063 [Phlyctochytrium arcticum]|nr:hypothetical protein DFS34DRAFT_619063 [Phlyctochytrium arcticum]
MLSLRLARATVLARPASLRWAAPAARAFSQSTVARADFVTDLYLQELRNYTPAKQASADKVDLPTTFTAPTPPAKPEVERAVAQATATGEEIIEEEEWPPVYNPIDDPANYPDEWEYRTEKDDGNVIPRRLIPVDYNH